MEIILKITFCKDSYDHTLAMDQSISLLHKYPTQIHLLFRLFLKPPEPKSEDTQ